jgi:hypothetical protein
MENFANSLLFSMQSELQRISARSAPKYATIARISRLCLDKPDCRERTSRRQRGDRPAFSPEGICAVRFQRRASEGVRRMQCDQKSMMWRSPLDSLLRNSLPPLLPTIRQLGSPKASFVTRGGCGLLAGAFVCWPSLTALQGVMAMTRSGLPEPPTIFSGAAMTMAPVGGS